MFLQNRSQSHIMLIYLIYLLKEMQPTRLLEGELLMKKAIYVLTVIVCTTCFLHANQPIPVTTQILKKITPSKTYFNGKAVPVQTGKFGTPNAGILIYTASPGAIVYSQIKNQKGEIVRQGTPIIIQDGYIAKLAIETAQNNLHEVERLLQNKKTILQRYQKLNLKRKNLIAQNKMDDALTDYDTTNLKVKKCEFALKEAKINLERCTIYPDFTGQVDEVYFAPGAAIDKNKDIVEVTMMDPMAVELKLPLTLINNLSIENIIKVYSADNSKPIEAILCKNPIDPSTTTLLVANELVPIRELTPEQKKLPVVHQALFAIRAFKSEGQIYSLTTNSTAPIAVPINSIKKDDKGSYVWRAVGQKVLDNKKIKAQFTVEKVYITLGDIIRHVSWIKGKGSYFRSIKETDKILLHDLLIVDVPDGLKVGDEVVFQELHWYFTVNEKVKITISGLQNPGFYVPFTAIFNEYLGTPQVCVVRDDKAVFINIKLTGAKGEYIGIEGDTLKGGDQIVLDINNALQNVYEGAPLKVVQATETLAKLNHNVAKAYNAVTTQFQPAK
jgi:multidrug efflux pump subunit AcrA (membrane-fusion protein)